MGRLAELAYVRGMRMGDYIANRDGVAAARARGSMAEVVYARASMQYSYDKGYYDALKTVLSPTASGC